MKKILQINVVANWGSTGRIVEEIGMQSIQNGWESYVAYGRGNPVSKSHLIHVGNNIDIFFHLIESRLFDNHGLSSSSATKFLIRKIEEIKPDVIHLHNIHGYFLNYEILFSWLSKVNIPVVWTIHDCWPITGHCAYFSYAKCDKWKNSCGNCPQKNTYPASWLLDRSSRNLTRKQQSFSNIKNMTIITVSDWLKGIIQQSFLGREYDVRRIYNGIDTDIFHPYSNRDAIRSQYNITSQFMLIAAATTWSQRKGLSDIIELSKLLDSRFTIVVVGIKDNVKKNLPDNVIGISRTEDVHAMAALYSAADVVLNLSYEETFGLTTVEGLACGTPSVVYNATASPELIVENVGRIVSPGNIQKVKDAVLSIVSCPKDEKVVNCCRNFALSRFNKHDRYAEYIDLYTSLTE